MKIIQYTTRMDEIGGAQIHVLDLTKGLIERGHEVIVVSSGQGILTTELKELGIPYYTLRNLSVGIHPLRDSQNLLEFKKLVQNHQPDLIALHSSKSGIIGRVISKMFQIPTVFTVHGWSFSNVSPMKFRLYLSLERAVSRIPAGIISVSHYDDRLITKYLKGINKNRIVIHNGIHDTLSLSKPEETQDKVHLVMIARFAEPKDHELLLGALACLPRNNWHMTLVGDGPLLHKTKEKVFALGFNNQVTFPGEVRNVESILQKADIALLISKKEGLPISIIEAMRARLAIIASNVGGVPELIDHNYNGLLITKSNIHELVSALQLLINDFPKRKEFAYRARKKYEQQFSFQTMLEQTEKYYFHVLKEYPFIGKVGVQRSVL